jgi:FkbM family methyltransferase
MDTGHMIDYSRIPPDGIIVDAGACHGRFIDELAENIEHPSILALEPSKVNFKHLLKEYGERFVVKNVALTSKDEGRVMFREFKRLPEWGNTCGLYERKIKTHKNELYEVDTVGIDWVYEVSTQPIDYLKLDIEGREREVINEITQEMANNIKQISIEVHCYEQDIRDKLLTLGYEISMGEKCELYATRL